MIRHVALLTLVCVLTACGSDTDEAADPGSPTAAASANTPAEATAPAAASLEEFCVALNRVYYPEGKTGDDLQADVEGLRAVGTPSDLDPALAAGVTYFVDTVAAQGRSVTPDFVNNVGDSGTSAGEEGWSDLISGWFEDSCEPWQDSEAALSGSGTVAPGDAEPPAGLPEDVVRAYYAALAARDCPGIVATMSSRKRAEGVLCEGDPSAAFDSPAPSIEISRIRVQGDRAEVDVVEDGESGDGFEVTVVLVGEDGAWLINEFQSDY